MLRLAVYYRPSVDNLEQAGVGKYAPLGCHTGLL